MFRQICVFVRQNITVQKRNIMKNILSSLFVFSVVVYTTKDSFLKTYDASKTLLFSYTMACVWIGLFNTVLLYMRSKQYLIPDLKSRLLSVRAYMIGTIVIQAFQCMIQALIGASILTGFDYDRASLVLKKGSLNVDIFITIYLLILAGDMLGFLLSIVLKNMESALACVPIFLISQMLFSEGILSLGNDYLKTFSKGFIEARYGMAAFGSIFKINNLPLALNELYPEIVQTSNDLFEISSQYILSCWRHIGIMIIVPILLSGIILTIKVHKKS